MPDEQNQWTAQTYSTELLTNHKPTAISLIQFECNVCQQEKTNVRFIQNAEPHVFASFLTCILQQTHLTR